jgi:hypothetical protein
MRHHFATSSRSWSYGKKKAAMMEARASAKHGMMAPLMTEPKMPKGSSAARLLPSAHRRDYPASRDGWVNLAFHEHESFRPDP